MRTSAKTTAAVLRSCDVVAALDDGEIIAVLPETDSVQATSAAQRVAAELTRRGAHLNQRKWAAGVASPPDGGEDPPTLAITAIERARAH